MKVTVKKYEPIPEGTYHLITVSAEVRTSSMPQGGEFISWECEIDDPDYAGRTINFAMSPSFGPNSKSYKFMRALGMQDDTSKNFEFDTDDYLNIPFYAKITVEKNTKGDLVNKFDTIWSEEEYQDMIAKFSKSPANQKSDVSNNVSKPALSGTAAKQSGSSVKPSVKSAAPTAARPLNIKPPVQTTEEIEDFSGGDEIEFPE